MKQSDSMYTLEDDLFRKPSKRKNSGWGKWALVIILALLFVYRSTRPVMRLRADPPPSFYDYSPTWSKEERQHERSAARAYWQVAVQRIQMHYSPDKPLPADPPPSFQIGDAASSMERDIIASRIHYWYQLREVWRQRDAWETSYRWNTDWVENSLNSMQQNAPQWLSNGFQAVIGWFNAIAQRIPSSG